MILFLKDIERACIRAFKLFLISTFKLYETFEILCVLEFSNDKRHFRISKFLSNIINESNNLYFIN